MTRQFKLSTLLLLYVSISHGQETITIYLNSEFAFTSEERALCRCAADYDMDNFRLDGAIKCYFLNGAPKMIANYKAGLKNGFASLYADNGQLIFTGYYKDNLRDGIWHYNYPDGRLKQVIKFTDDPESRTVDGNIMIGEYFDDQGKQLVKNGNGTWSNDSIYSSWADSETLKIVKGQVKDSLKHGVWELRRANQRKVLHIEKFQNGRFTTGSVLIERDGDYGAMQKEMTQKLPDNFRKLFQNLETIKLDSTVFQDSIRHLDTEQLIEALTGKKYTIQTRSAGYKYGDFELMEYISANIQYPKEARQFGYSGTVIVQLTIDKEGLAKDVKVLKSVHASLDKEAVRVITTINDWVAGLHQGQPYEKSVAIPVRFQL
jgi:TonB family protein